MIKNILKIWIILLCLSATVSAQVPDEITPEEGKNRFYFTEELSSDENIQDQIKLKKADLQGINTQLSGYTVEKNDPDFQECKKLETEREKTDAIFNKFLPPPKKTDKQKTATPAPSSSPTQSSDRCTFYGSSSWLQFLQSNFKKASCSITDIQQSFKESDRTKLIEQASSKFTDTQEKEICKKEMLRIIMKWPPDTSKEKKQLTADQTKKIETCKTKYVDWVCSVAITDNLLKERNKILLDLQKLENPELYNCEYAQQSDGKMAPNNVVCVELSERIGSTRVIGAKTGIGLLKAYIALIYRYAAIIVGIIAFFMTIIYGLQIAIGGGEAMESAKKKLTGVLIGMAVLFLAGAILYIINPNFFTFV